MNGGCQEKQLPLAPGSLALAPDPRRYNLANGYLLARSRLSDGLWDGITPWLVSYALSVWGVETPTRHL